MPAVGVQIETEVGSVIASLAVPERALACLIPAMEDRSFRCLCFIDIVGDAVFNRLQMGDLRDEVRRVMPPKGNREVDAFFEGLLAMTHECANRPGSFVRFVGD